MNIGDILGIGCLLSWGICVLWIINRIVHKRDSLGSLFIIWPFVRPKEFKIWAKMSIAVLALFCVLLFAENDSVTLLARQHLETSGTFVDYPGNHGDFHYKFIVQGLIYHGYSSSDKISTDKIKSGFPFTVYYNPVNPNINSASDPIRHSVLRRFIMMFFCVLFMGVLAIFTRKFGTLMRGSSVAASDCMPS